MSSSEHLSGLVFEEFSSVDNYESYANSGTLNANQIVVTNSVFQEQQQPPNAGHPDPEVEVVALSPNSLMKKNRFLCELCNKGFQRDQNLQLHRRGHNLPWKLKSTKSQMNIRKKVYLCPEPTCPHHCRSKALGDLTGIKKHFLRKHCEKKYKCLKCSKCYAVHSDLKAHMKNCGSNCHTCDCGLIFGRKDTFRTHKAFCEALAAETERVSASHPRLADTSSDDSANETVNFYNNLSDNNILPPPGSFPPVNHHHHPLITSDIPLGINNNYISLSDGPNINQVLKDEPITAIIRHAAATEENYYGMSQVDMQNYGLLERVNMIGGAPVEDMMGSTIMNQMGGVPLPVDYYYLMSKQSQNEQPTRDFLSLAVGHGGGGGTLGGATNVDLIGHGSCGGWGRNEYGGGSEWFPRMTKFENDEDVNANDQIYGFSGGMNVQEKK